MSLRSIFIITNFILNDERCSEYYLEEDFLTAINLAEESLGTLLTAQERQSTLGYLMHEHAYDFQSNNLNYLQDLYLSSIYANSSALEALKQGEVSQAVSRMENALNIKIEPPQRSDLELTLYGDLINFTIQALLDPNSPAFLTSQAQNRFENIIPQITNIDFYTEG